MFGRPSVIVQAPAGLPWYFYALTALATIVAVFLASWLTDRRERKNWLRDQRLKAYTDAHELLANRTTMRSQDFWHSFQALEARLILLGPDEPYETWFYLRQQIEVLADRTASKEQVGTAKENVESATYALYNQTRWIIQGEKSHPDSEQLIKSIRDVTAEQAAGERATRDRD
ncbi:hypothetical protein [Serinicoccus hydrothermalis]|uniref:hypothetical protein n=1 Tax=Serinicoccus hydrothermalis TaxID=1758689 RepID=UPI0012F87815|nr:hypothetical protein [Serinicoccus hydrothermalis]